MKKYDTGGVEVSFAVVAVMITAVVEEAAGMDEKVIGFGEGGVVAGVPDGDEVAVPML